MNLTLLAATNTSQLLQSIVPLIVLAFGLTIGRFVLLGARLRRRAEFLEVLRSEVPEFYRALGAPSLTIWQQLFHRRDCLANDRLWFYALWRADIFPDEPRVRAALAAYRHVELLGLGYTALVLIVVGLLFVFMHR